MRNTLYKFFGFTVIMLCMRVHLTGHYSFFFLLWNLFLAWLPCWFIKHARSATKPLNKNLLIGLTILFLPNAPYITTDLFHLTKSLAAPLWFDTVLILNFSLMGLICFVHAANLLFIELKNNFSSAFWYRLIKLTVLFLCGYGIYLGRYLRFNSWDIVIGPVKLFEEMYQSVFSPGHFNETFGVSLTFAVFLYLILELYEFIKPQNKTYDLPQKTQ